LFIPKKDYFAKKSINWLEKKQVLVSSSLVSVCLESLNKQILQQMVTGASRVSLS